MRSQQQAVLITPSQQFAFLPSVLSENWPNGVNDMSRRQFTGRCDHSFARRQAVWIGCAPDLAAGFDDCRATNAMDRAINACPAHQRGIGCVDDRVNVLFCNIANGNNYASGEKLLFRWRVQALVLKFVQETRTLRYPSSSALNFFLAWFNFDFFKHILSPQCFGNAFGLAFT